MLDNILLWTDTYNITHFELRDPQNHTDIAYMYNRSKPIRLFGLAGRINTIMKTQITYDDIQEAEDIAKTNGLNFPTDLFNSVVKDFDGYVPLRFSMLPEFILLPSGTPFCKIQNTQPGFHELCTYWEGYLTHSYFTSACFTRAMEISRITNNIHNFGYRGSSCNEESALSALSMSLVFAGTDTFLVNEFFTKHSLFIEPYKEILANITPPNSIRACSHKVIQSFEEESLAAYENLLRRTAGQTIALPIDTFSSKRFIDKFLTPLLHLADTYGVTLNFRIDSGDVLAYAKAVLEKILIHEISQQLNQYNNILYHKIIISDHMTVQDIEFISIAIDNFLKERFCPSYQAKDHVYFGWGANFYNDLTRDSIGFVTKLGMTDGYPTMKTTEGKESLIGDFDVSLSPNFVIVTHSIRTLNGYRDYNDAVNIAIFASEREKARNHFQTRPPSLLISDSVTEEAKKFKEKIFKQ